MFATTAASVIIVIPEPPTVVLLLVTLPSLKHCSFFLIASFVCSFIQELAQVGLLFTGHAVPRRWSLVPLIVRVIAPGSVAAAPSTSASASAFASFALSFCAFTHPRLLRRPAGGGNVRPATVDSVQRTASNAVRTPCVRLPSLRRIVSFF